MINPVRVVYFCSGCKQRITRKVYSKDNRFYPSFCETAGKIIRMRKSRDQSDTH